MAQMSSGPRYDALWRQTSGDGDWPQAPTCTRLRDTTVRSRVATWNISVAISAWASFGLMPYYNCHVKFGIYKKLAIAEAAPCC